ncbi:hypothetical protein P153DRAFT_383028 [Dothidotthia symphoricarpi CBS 119687]|uniref:Rhodopsin domain-containing protein n=1 Tax=Dothidotthia symphoricarpi CBS 119687 TaxID=1392245 RepID=A0A6A6ALY4_9PLEO|nr:uncharacterized protein P153DRAFT_383028 [Dothidotthia symphoricarpi CBS 119687]KAF2132138.1 hypothetical protein P153DRAFT_383028 [Dothidotthia symphoricarpi CBS 119687]
MRLPPIAVILTWPNPNYVNPETRGDALLIVNSIFISLTIIVVALRLYTRLVIKRWLGIDDVFILLALFFTIGLTAVVLVANQSYGWDRHVYDIEFYKLEPTSKIAMAAKIVFTAAATFTRLSLHCLYYRLVQDSGMTWFKWIVHANVAYSLAIFVSYTFIAIFLCTPIENYWKLDAPADSCLDEGIATLVCGIISTVADFVTAVTPIPVIMGLHMPLRQRFGAAFLFALGVIVTIAGIIRTWYIYKSLMVEDDTTWYAYPLWIAAAVEVDLGVICASAPALRPLLARISFSPPGSLSPNIVPIYNKPTERSSARCKEPTTCSSRSFSKNSKLASTLSSNVTTQGSISIPLASVLSSKRRSGVVSSAPELSQDRGKSYEMKPWNPWDDVERGILSHRPERENSEPYRSSQDVILETEEEARPGAESKSLWSWGRTRSSADTEAGTTIMRTEEFEVRNERSEHREHRHGVKEDRH